MLYTRAELFLANSKLFAFCMTYFPPKIYKKYYHQKQFSIPKCNLNDGGWWGSDENLLESLYRPRSSIYGNLVHANICQTFAKFTLKMAGNTKKSIWQPGSTRAHWGSLQRSPDPVAGFQGREGQGRKGKEVRERELEDQRPKSVSTTQRPSTMLLRLII